MAKGGVIQFRVKQNATTVANDDKVKIFAPPWVRTALAKLSRELNGAQFDIGSDSDHPRQIKIKNRITLKDLVSIARSEQNNTTGIIQYDLYRGISRRTIIALRDLAKHCVIVGKDKACRYGGYPHGAPLHNLDRSVYICDLPGLQFQQLDNTGRHVVVFENDMPRGALDNEIYENTVGEKKPTMAQAAINTTGRYISGEFKGKYILFDTKAYQAFVAQDFVLAAMALNTQANKTLPRDNLNFKFLKYGAGFFAENLQGEAKRKLSEQLCLGVLKGLRQLLALPPASRNRIKRLELPFYEEDQNARVAQILNDIRKLCQRNDIEFSCNDADALEQTSPYTTATTNCSDPHAPMGNEMNYGSVDAAIAENLRLKGNNFNPICNPKMKAAYLNIGHRYHLNAEAKDNSVWPFLGRLAVSAVVSGFVASTIPAFAMICFALMMGSELVKYARNCFKSNQYHEYHAKTDTQIDALDRSQLESFIQGKRAARRVSDQALSLFHWQTYRHPKAYYAGYETQLKADDVLAEKIVRRLV